MKFDKDFKHPFLGIQALRKDLGPVFFLKSNASMESMSFSIIRVNSKPQKCASLEAVEKKFIKSALAFKPFSEKEIDYTDPDALAFHILRASNNISKSSLRGVGRTLLVNPKQELGELEKKLIANRYTVIRNSNIPLKTSLLLFVGPTAFDNVGLYTPKLNDDNEIIGHYYTQIDEYFEKYVRVIKLE